MHPREDNFNTDTKNLVTLNKMINRVQRQFKSINFNKKTIKIKKLYDFKANNNTIVIFFMSRERLSNLRKIQAYLLKEIEISIPNTIMLFCEMKATLSYKFQRKTNNKNYFKSYTFVLDHMIRNIVFPALIIGKRIFFYNRGVSIMHIYVESKDFNISQFKANMITFILKKLFNKDIVIEIVKNANK